MIDAYRAEVERDFFSDRCEAEMTALSDVIRRNLREVSSGKNGDENNEHPLGTLRRDMPITDIKTPFLSDKHMADWRNKRVQSMSGSAIHRDLSLLAS